MREPRPAARTPRRGSGSSGGPAWSTAGACCGAWARWAARSTAPLRSGRATGRRRAIRAPSWASCATASRSTAPTTPADAFPNSTSAASTPRAGAAPRGRLSGRGAAATRRRGTSTSPRNRGAARARLHGISTSPAAAPPRLASSESPRLGRRRDPSSRKDSTSRAAAPPRPVSAAGGAGGEPADARRRYHLKPSFPFVPTCLRGSIVGGVTHAMKEQRCNFAGVESAYSDDCVLSPPLCDGREDIVSELRWLWIMMLAGGPRRNRPLGRAGLGRFGVARPLPRGRLNGSTGGHGSGGGAALRPGARSALERCQSGAALRAGSGRPSNGAKAPCARGPVGPRTVPKRGGLAPGVRSALERRQNVRRLGRATTTLGRRRSGRRRRRSGSRPRRQTFRGGDDDAARPDRRPSSASSSSSGPDRACTGGRAEILPIGSGVLFCLREDGAGSPPAPTSWTTVDRLAEIGSARRYNDKRAPPWALGICSAYGSLVLLFFYAPIYRLIYSGNGDKADEYRAPGGISPSRPRRRRVSLASSRPRSPPRTTRAQVPERLRRVVFVGRRFDLRSLPGADAHHVQRAS